MLFVRLFDLCLSGWICRFPLPFGVWEGLRFVIVALPGLFSYHFFYQRLYGQNNMADAGFNAPVYLILLSYNAIIRIYFICTTSSLI